MTGYSLRSRVRRLSVFEGAEAVEAYFCGHRFSPHRHDTYTLGYTICGVQRFRYRGAERFSRPGDVFVLHPDELHDGWPGTDEGYGYRAIYLNPGLVSDALGGAPLPFLAKAVSRQPSLRTAITEAICDPAETQDSLAPVAAVAALADRLATLEGKRRSASRQIDAIKMTRIRDHLEATAVSSVGVSSLEREYGIDRYSLSRQFRACFGVSPWRFVILRRLDEAKRQILAGASLADAASISGFADQSHMTRQFRRAFGLTPGEWRRLLT